ncbi:MAG: dTDP-glucose 4,6-dehydratase [Myxococcota bacterium]|jgi:dTDP-glucose 4,6-dehydratase
MNTDQTLLVTGGAGFIGSHFVWRRRVHRPEQRIVVLDALTYAGDPHASAGIEGVTFIQGNVCDGVLVRRILADHAVGGIVHLAAETHVDRSLADAEVFVRTNVLGTATLLAAARDHGQIEAMVHVSTDEVYGELADGAPPWTPNQPLAPRSPYAASKASADHLAQAWFDTFGLPVCITRCTNNYGPRQTPEKLVPVIITRALAGAPIPIYGDGLQRRSWIHVEDHCDGLEAALDRGEPGQIYHLASDEEHDNLTIVRRILQTLDLPETRISHVRDRQGHDRRYALNTAETKKALAFAPKRSLEMGISETVAWYVDNPAWVAAALTRMRAS